MGKVFIFEHDSNTQNSIREVLECEGHDVVGSADATIALKRVLSMVDKDGKGPDIILLEYFAPEGDPQYRGGSWLAKELRRCMLTCKIPIIIMCHVGSKKTVAEMSRHFIEEYSAAGFIKKPFQLDTVKNAVNGILWVNSPSM